jgi:hypothetical protein
MSGSTNLTPETNNYAAPGTYTSTFDILSPPPLAACSQLDPVIFSTSCSGCSSTPLIASLCRFLELLFLFLITAGLSMGLSQPCPSSSGALYFLGGGALALVFYLALQCQKCSCDFWLKDWATILIATGLVNVMFVPAGGCSAVTLFPAALNSIFLLTMGTLAMVSWYNNNKQTCSLIACDPWCAVCGISNVRSASNTAILVALLIYGLNSAAYPGSYFGLLVALLVTTSFAVYIWTAGPLSQPPCTHHPTCR